MIRNEYIGSLVNEICDRLKDLNDFLETEKRTNGLLRYNTLKKDIFKEMFYQLRDTNFNIDFIDDEAKRNIILSQIVYEAYRTEIEIKEVYPIHDTYNMPIIHKTEIGKKSLNDYRNHLKCITFHLTDIIYNSKIIGAAEYKKDKKMIVYNIKNKNIIRRD